MFAQQALYSLNHLPYPQLGHLNMGSEVCTILIPEARLLVYNERKAAMLRMHSKNHPAPKASSSLTDELSIKKPPGRLWADGSVDKGLEHDSETNGRGHLVWKCAFVIPELGKRGQEDSQLTVWLVWPTW